jgi:hypothetical protein
MEAELIVRTDGRTCMTKLTGASREYTKTFKKKATSNLFSFAHCFHIYKTFPHKNSFSSALHEAVFTTGAEKPNFQYNFTHAYKQQEKWSFKKLRNLNNNFSRIDRV